MVYLELQGGKERGLDLGPQAGAAARVAAAQNARGDAPRSRPQAPRSTPEERAAHTAFVDVMLKDKALWRTLGFTLDA